MTADAPVHWAAQNSSRPVCAVATVRRRVAQTAAGLVSLALAIPGITGCGGPSRSVAGYCSYFYGEGSTLRNQWIKADANTNSDPLTALATVFGAPRQLADFFHHLAERAPNDISDDVQTIADAFKQQADSLGDAAMNPLGGLASGLVNGLASMGAYNRVDAWTRQHCGPPPSS
jgi:hypothetical protein